MDRPMMLTVEEYLFLRRLIDGASDVSQVVEEPGQTVKRKARRKSAYSRAVGIELRKLNKRYKTKKGVYRKGYDAGRIMKMAHKNMKRGLK